MDNFIEKVVHFFIFAVICHVVDSLFILAIETGTNGALNSWRFYISKVRFDVGQHLVIVSLIKLALLGGELHFSAHGVLDRLITLDWIVIHNQLQGLRLLAVRRLASSATK